MLSKDFTQSLVILIVATALVASFSIVVLIVPNLVRTDAIRVNSLAKPLTAVQVAGRDIYISEGCHVCHTQMVRNIEPEVKRDGRANKESDDIYEFPNLWGSKRTGPDLTNLGRKYSEQWQRIHLINPRQVVPTSLMPAYPWLFTQILSGDEIEAKMRALQTLGVPYTDDEIERARLQVKGLTKGEALIQYLQSLGQDTADDQER
ncbi:cbb3-type cytochrome c oxidase subunit II [uncultured Shewanella sp.]|uniref:cbb3-type cytochrome c oxidase subunit II n=1 Tax=uncultured Shewanella sp. TaxID=173975 RepID=UPI002633D007|nr:cbb3-type cytochrome c oxidase subunit II [uncultured Shewanella sp.]